MWNGHWCAATGMSREVISRQRLVGSYSFPSPGLLTGAPQFQQHAVMPAVSSIHWPQAHEACLAKCNFRSHWLTTVVHELVNKPYITPSSHFGLPGFWFVASDLWNTFPSHSGTAFPAFRVSHGFTPSKKPSLRITIQQRSILPVHETVRQVENQREHRQGCADELLSWRAEHPAFAHRPVLWLPPWASQSR